MKVQKQKRKYTHRKIAPITVGMLNPVIACFKRGACLRGQCCIELCHSLSEDVYGIRIQQKGYGTNIKCYDPATNKADISKYADLNEHQFHIKNKLSAFLTKISASGITKMKFKDFENLYSFVASNSTLKAKDSLLVYDFCVRYGDSIGIKPDKYVYYFAGAKTGAEHLFGRLPVKDFRRERVHFNPYVGSLLDSREIESFLCVCKDCIAAGKPLKP